jgi:Ca2+-binding RTX toxin-like protein
MTKAQNTVTAGSDTLSGFENLTGSEFNDTLTGNLGSNVLTGLGGNDRLDGGAGADWLLGGAGSDIYVVDNVDDVVDETDGAGTDTVLAAISFRLCDVGHAIGSIENLTLTGTRAVLGTGNALDNIIVGNSANNILTGLGGNDTLDGSAGADKMFGGTGNDIYVVDNAGDVVDDETGGGGTDTVKTSITFSLADPVHAMGSIENLILTGTSSINGTGNAIDNVVSGNSANNVLAGGLNGGVGDTVSYANAASGANGVGVTVNLSMTKAQNTVTAGSDTLSGFENLTGSEFNDTLTGDSSNNVLTGLGGNDRLDGGFGADSMFGGVGNDTLIGNLGADTLTGGSGQDRFVFLSAGEGGDILKDFVVTDDNLVFSASGFGGGLAPRQQLVTGSTFIANAAPTANAAEGSFLYNTVTHDLFWDVDGSGGGEAVQIAHFDTAVVLTAHQFEIMA